MRTSPPPLLPLPDAGGHLGWRHARRGGRGSRHERVRLAPPNAPPLPPPPRWFGCVDWLPQHDAIHAPPALLAGLVGPPLPRPWQHRCVVEQLDPVTLVWSDVGHVNMGKDADDCYASNAWCPIDGASGAAIGSVLPILLMWFP